MAVSSEMAEVGALIDRIVAGWVDDPDMPATYAEWVDGRLAVRILQSARDVSTVWIEVGERTVGFEAYVLPSPRQNEAAIHRQLLRRNDFARFARFCIDKDGEIYLRVRLAVEWVDEGSLETVFSEIAGLVDRAFPVLVREGFGAGGGEPRS